MSLVADFSAQFTKSVPMLKPGLTVRVHQKIQEGDKARIQIFEGLIIKANSGSGADATFTVRKIVDGVGVEKIFPLYSANIAKIEVKKASRVRRSKLYFMRDRSGKSANLRELRIDLSQFDAPAEEQAPEAPAAVSEEAPTEEQAPEAPAAVSEEAPTEEQASEAPAKSEEQEEKKEE